MNTLRSSVFHTLLTAILLFVIGGLVVSGCAGSAASGDESQKPNQTSEKAASPTSPRQPKAWSVTLEESRQIRGGGAFAETYVVDSQGSATHKYWQGSSVRRVGPNPQNRESHSQVEGAYLVGLKALALSPRLDDIVNSRERGRYELKVMVDEETRVFYSADGNFPGGAGELVAALMRVVPPLPPIPPLQMPENPRPRGPKKPGEAKMP